MTDHGTSAFVQTLDDLKRRAADLGLRFEEERYSAALAAHAGMRASLDRLRAVPLSFLEPVEPDSALVWLENGGRS